MFDFSVSVAPAPTSPREIKSYHLIDLSALDSPETRRKTDNSKSSPSCVESSFRSVADHFGRSQLRKFTVCTFH